MKTMNQHLLLFFSFACLLNPSFSFGQSPNLNLSCNPGVDRVIDLTGLSTFTIQAEIFGDSPNVCLTNGQGTVVNFVGTIGSPVANLILTEQNDGVLIEGITYIDGAVASSIISYGRASISKIKSEISSAGNGVFALGIGATGQNASLVIGALENQDPMINSLTQLKAQKGAQITLEQQIILGDTRAIAQLEVLEGSRMEFEGGLQVKGNNARFEVNQGDLTIALDLNFEGESGAFKIDNHSRVKVGGNVLISPFGDFSLSVSEMFIGQNLELPDFTFVGLRPFANLSIDGQIRVQGGQSSGSVFTYSSEPNDRSCAQVSSVGGISDPFVLVGDSPSIKLCDWPSSIFEKGNAELVFGIDCGQCLPPEALDPEQFFSGVNVGDTITIKGNNFSSSTQFLIPDDTQRPVAVAELIDATTIKVIIPSMPERSTIRLINSNDVVSVALNPIVITSASSRSVKSSDELFIRGSNLKSVTSFIYQTPSGVIVPIAVDSLDALAQDSVRIVTPIGFNCQGRLRAIRNSGFEEQVSNQAQGLFDSPTQVTNPIANLPGSFRAILLNVCDQDTITFDPDVVNFAYEEILMDQGGDLPVPKNIVIQGNGVSQTILSDNNESNEGIALRGVENYTFQNLTIKDHTSDATRIPTPALLITGSSSVNFDSVRFENNKAGFGSGAVWVEGSFVGFRECVFVNNSGIDGGAVGLEQGADARFIQCAFENNQAVNRGGAIFHAAQSPALEILRSTFKGNSAQSIGGALYANRTQIQSSTFYQNVALESGSAIYIASDSLTLNNSTIYRNMGSTAIFTEGTTALLTSNAIGQNSAGSITELSSDFDHSNLRTIRFRNNFFSDLSRFSPLLTASESAFNVITNDGLMYLDPIPVLEGIQTYFKPLSFSPLVNNGALEPQPLLSPGTIALDSIRDQRGVVFSENTDIGAVDFSRAPAIDPMYITTLKDTAEVGSIRAAEIFYNSHYPSDTILFDPALGADTIKLASGLFVNLLLDRSGAPADRTLRIIDGLGIVFAPGPRFDPSDENELIESNEPLNFKNLVFDGLLREPTRRLSGDCIDLKPGSGGSVLDGIVTTNCQVGMNIQTDTIEIVNAYSFNNSRFGIVIRTNAAQVDSTKMKIYQNVIGLDPSLSKPKPGVGANNGFAGVAIAGDHQIFGSEFRPGNIVAGNDGTGILVAGESNEVLGNYIGILKDTATIIPNPNGLAFFSQDLEGLGDAVRFNLVGRNVIAGSRNGIQMLADSSEFRLAEDFFGNVFALNTYISNDTAINVPAGFQAGILPPTVLVRDSLVMGMAVTNSFVHVYLDDGANGRYLLDTFRVTTLDGSFTLDLTSYRDLPQLPNVTAMQALEGAGSSALSKPTAIDCASFQDALSAWELPLFCLSPNASPPELVEITSPFTSANAIYSWFEESSSEPSQRGLNPRWAFNSFGADQVRFYLSIELENGCLVQSDTLTQQIGQGLEVEVFSIDPPRCFGSSDALFGFGIQSPSRISVIELSPASGTLSTDSTLFSDLSAGEYQLYIESESGCSDTAFLNIENPSIDSSKVRAVYNGSIRQGNQISVCPELTFIDLLATTSPNASVASYTWFTSGDPSSFSVPDFSGSLRNDTTTYILETLDERFCVTGRDSVSIVKGVLDQFELTLDPQIGEPVAYTPVLDSLFACSAVFTTFVSDVGNTITWDAGTDVLENPSNPFTITSLDGQCSVRDSVLLYFNRTTPLVLNPFTLTGLSIVTRTRVSGEVFEQITSARLISATDTYGSTRLIETAPGDFELVYTSSSDLNGLIDSARVAFMDRCERVRMVDYVFEHVNRPPRQLNPVFAPEDITISLLTNSVVTLDFGDVIDDQNNNDFIRVINKLQLAPFFGIEDELNPNGEPVIRITTIGAIPDSSRQKGFVDILYQICDSEGCNPEDTYTLRVKVPPLDLLSPIGVIEGDLDLTAFNKKDIRELLTIRVINSAVTNNVGLRFEFEWDNEPIDIQNLDYELTLLSRWNDVVYQEAVQGKNVQWKGEYLTSGSSEKVPNGDYFWVLKVNYISQNGGQGSSYESGYLYYLNVESVYQQED